MGMSGAVDWWEEWQLRVLVLGSLLVQWFLFASAPKRKLAISSWFRSLIWLAYLGSDAIAIYALANLFSRQRRQDCRSGQSNSILEVVWAPILLMHLGGYDSISAYNIEDNEMWTRHVLTAVSQITVAIYVFCTSWPGDDKRLLQVAILFFTPGIIKCLLKPWALKRASINSLVSFHDPSQRMDDKAGEINTLEQYLHKAKDIVQDYEYQGQGEGDAVGLEPNRAPQARGDGSAVDLEVNRLSVFQAKAAHDEQRLRLRSGPYRLFVDRASSYPDRLSMLNKFWDLDDPGAYKVLQEGLSGTFALLYTKASLGNAASENDRGFYAWIALITVLLPFAAIGLFHNSHRGAYDVNDVKVTYALICSTAVLELASMSYRGNVHMSQLPNNVAQYSLVNFFVRNRRHSKKMCILSSINCKDFLDQRWCTKSCYSSFRITMLVRRHVKDWWKHTVDAASYMRFSDYRGQWTIQRTECNRNLGRSLNRPFESILLWHIATDLCFYQKVVTSASHGNAMECRKVSNYMVYLLFVNPEMLLPGTNRNLFKTANDELEEFLKDDKPLLKAILKGEKPSLMEILKGNRPILDFLTRKEPSSEEIEKGIMDRIIAKLEATDCKEEDPGIRQPTTQKGFIYEEDPRYIKFQADTKKAFIHDAWKLSQGLLALGDEKKAWEVIEGVWVEMLCFSATRCRGYLHAKSLGTGGELLTYIWLLLSYMGRETLPERLQRTEVPGGGGNTGATSPTSQIPGSEDPPPLRRQMPHDAAVVGASTSGPQEIQSAE